MNYHEQRKRLRRVTSLLQPSSRIYLRQQRRTTIVANCRTFHAVRRIPRRKPADRTSLRIHFTIRRTRTDRRPRNGWETSVKRFVDKRRTWSMWVRVGLLRSFHSRLVRLGRRCNEQRRIGRYFGESEENLCRHFRRYVKPRRRTEISSKLFNYALFFSLSTDSAIVLILFGVDVCKFPEHWYYGQTRERVLLSSLAKPSLDKNKRKENRSLDERCAGELCSKSNTIAWERPLEEIPEINR